MGCAATFQGPEHPIPWDTLRPRRGLCEAGFIPPSLCVPFIPPKSCRKTCADPGHGISLTMGQMLRAAPASLQTCSPGLSRISSRGKVCDVDRERQGTKAAGRMSRPTRRRSAVSIVNGARQEPAAGAMRGSPLIGPGGGRRSLCATEHKELVYAELSVLLTRSEIIPRQTSKLAFKDEKYGQLEGKRHSAAAPSSFPRASSHAAAFGFIALVSGGVLGSLRQLLSPPQSKGIDTHLGRRRLREATCIIVSTGGDGARAKPGIRGSLASRSGGERSWREAAEGLRMAKNLCSKAAGV